MAERETDQKSDIDLVVQRACKTFKFADKHTHIVIALDFEGTCTEYSYPSIGKELPECVRILKEWQQKYRVKYILNTMRSTYEMTPVVNWFKERGISIFGVGKHPRQKTWTNTNKCHATFCIDDRNIPQFLTLDTKGQACVDWLRLSDYFNPVLERVYQYIEYLRQL